MKRGFCERDYVRRWRAGALPPKAPKPPCSVCGSPSEWKGFCKKHYFRQYNGKDPAVDPVRALPDEERFWAKVNKVPCEHGCWLWTNPGHGAGYGTIYWHGRQQLAHRIAYQLAIGPIPEHMQIDHVWDRGCRHRHCVNPAHLEPVSLAENVRRAQVGERRYNGDLVKAHAKRRLTARFWSRVKTGEAGECWPWLGYVDPKGVARFWWEKASHPAQRIAFKLGSLQDAPDGLVVENSCPTPNCMNPEHLVAVPRALSRGYTRPGRREELRTASKKGLAVRWGRARGPAT